MIATSMPCHCRPMARHPTERLGGTGLRGSIMRLFRGARISRHDAAHFLARAIRSMRHANRCAIPASGLALAPSGRSRHRARRRPSQRRQPAPRARPTSLEDPGGREAMYLVQREHWEHRRRHEIATRYPPVVADPWLHAEELAVAPEVRPMATAMPAVRTGRRQAGR